MLDAGAVAWYMIIIGKCVDGYACFIEVWADIHRDELIANWQIVHEDGEPFKIEPLR